MEEGFAVPAIRPLRQRKLAFVLTPLIDVMFLLLIFFMLSSQISPYSLLPVGGVVAGASGRTGAAGASVGAMVVHVSRGTARIGGRHVPAADLAAHFDRLVASGVEAFVVAPGLAANVQDVVSVLEALKSADAAQVTLVSTGAARR